MASVFIVGDGYYFAVKKVLNSPDEVKQYIATHHPGYGGLRVQEWSTGAGGPEQQLREWSVDENGQWTAQ